MTEADAKANAQQQSQAEESYVRTVEDFRDLKDGLFRTLKARVDGGECSIMELIHTLRIVKTELGEPTVITQGKMNMEQKNPFEDILKAMFPSQQEATPSSFSS